MDPNENPIQVALDGVIIALAAHRITRLITADKVWAASRVRLLNNLHRMGPDNGHIMDNRSQAMYPRYKARHLLPAKAAEALGCQLCAGVWVSAATLAGWRYGGPKVRTAIRATAVVGVQSWLATRA
jgi:hypothetical protein